MIRKISIADVEAALKAADGSNTTVDVPVTEVTSFFSSSYHSASYNIYFTCQLNLSDSIQTTNGGTGPYHSSLLLTTSGQDSLPPSIALVNPRSPNNVTVLLDNYYGRQFNSLNDIKIHRPTGNFLFTDVRCVSIVSFFKDILNAFSCFSSYGFLNHFRPEPLMPNQVYRLDPVTRRVRVVATDFNKCNGIALSEDGKLAYMYVFPFSIPAIRLTSRLRTIALTIRSDTAALDGFFGNNQTEPATMQVLSTQFFFGLFKINCFPFATTSAASWNAQLRIRCGSR